MSVHGIRRSGRLALLLAPILLLQGCGESSGPLAPDTAPPAMAAAASPVNLEFDKCIIDPAGVWEGSTSGDITGDLTTVLRGLRITGPIWHVDFDWIIDAGDRSLVARLSGILNTATGAVVMNGTVVQGHLLGARVHEQGQMYDAEASCFRGTIRIMPASGP